jgi:peptidoglycan-associated lipoprotein
LAQASALCKKGQCKKAEEFAAMAESQARLAQKAAQEKMEANKASEFVLDQRGSLDTDPLRQGGSPLQDVPFDFDSAELSARAKSILSQNASFLQQNPNLRVKIEGHCDERGTDEYNLALGAKRAKSVYNYLLSLGVAASRMETISYGESMPNNSGNDENAWASNRRAHFEGLQY